MTAIRFTFILFACAWASQALAGTAGVFQFVAGDVQVALAGGGGRPAAKGSPISVGDTVTTAKASMAQIKMGDGAIIVVQPESELTVAEFSYAGKEDGTEKVQFRLQQGGFRSVTGAIGHTNKGNYMIETPIAHIGVRGTDHESWYFPSRVSSDGGATEAGLYNRVNVGLTYIQTAGGEVVIGPNQVGYASTAVDRPRLLDTMPEFFNRSIQPRSVRGGGQQPAATMMARGAEQGQPGASGAISGSSGSLAGFAAPRGKEGVSFGETAVNPVISPSGATLANAGSDSTLGVNWGTWQGGMVRVNGRPTSGSVNFISSTNLTTAAQLAALPPQVMTATYNYVPGTGAVTGTGSATNGTINSLSVGVNLTTQTVTNYAVNATVGSQNWNGNGSGSFTQYMSSGISIDGKCAGCTPGAGSPTAHGTATGAFVGGQAGGMITSFGMKAANQSMSGTGQLSR
jgi:hypothetical protein